jgi:putative membrane protein
MNKGATWIALCALVGLLFWLTGLAPAQEQNTNSGTNTNAGSNMNAGNTNSRGGRRNRNSNSNAAANVNANAGDTGGNMNSNTQGGGNTNMAGGTSGNMNTAGGANSNAAGGALAASDRKFVLAAGMGGMAEVQLGQLAVQRAASDDVKQFGQRMVDDHTRANNELMQVASQKGITLPTALDAKHQADMNKLSGLSGADFDRAYMKLMVKDHQKDTKEFRKEADKGQDADVKGFAARTLPTLEEHLRMAQTTAAATGGARGGNTNAGTSGGSMSTSGNANMSGGMNSNVSGNTNSNAGHGKSRKNNANSNSNSGSNSNMSMNSNNSNNSNR